MKKQTFKTNIMCSGCLSKVTPALDAAVGKDKWQVDIMTPGKTLTVESEKVNAADVIAAVLKAGYKAESL